MSLSPECKRIIELGDGCYHITQDTAFAPTKFADLTVVQVHMPYSILLPLQCCERPWFSANFMGALQGIHDDFEKIG